MLRRGVKIIVILFSIVGFISLLNLFIFKKTAIKQNPTPVRVELVQLGTLQEFISAPGVIEPKTKVDIIARVSASIQELPFKEGQTVKAGDIVVKLDSKEYESRLKNAEAGYKAQQAQLEVAKTQIGVRKTQLKGTAATLEQAKNDYLRQKQLLETHDISQSIFELAQQKLIELQSQYDSASEQIRAEELGLTVTEYNLEAIRAQIDEAREALDYTIMRSPIDGVVTQINNEIGEMVTGSMNYSGSLIMTVADLSKMMLVAQVDEADVGKIRIGQEANIRVKAYWDMVYKGKIVHIALVDGERGNAKYNTGNMSNTSKYYRTEILIEGDVSKLYTGLTADVDIFTNTFTNILKVPSQAVLSRKFDDLPVAVRNNNPVIDPNKNDITVVFRCVDGKTAATPVEIGPGDATHIIIKRGLSAGDQIVTGPYKVLDAIRHEQLVRDEKEIEAEKNAKDKGKETKSESEKKTAATAIPGA